jgi:glycosyltransferase involved in cell wall biosynthesis
MGGVIVEGNVNRKAFSNVIMESKIFILPNFAETYLFADNETIASKYNLNDGEEISILYLSNLLPGKGYIELANAFLNLDENIQKKLKLTFVGGFESISDEDYFLKLIKQSEKIDYLGKFIDHGEKKKLYDNTHVFCLPTYYPYEGLPIAILEAYASGCAVITTPHSGIPDVFQEGVNGFQVEKGSIESLKICLSQLHENKSKLMEFAMNNRNQASENHNIDSFSMKLKNIFKAI